MIETVLLVVVALTLAAVLVLLVQTRRDAARRRTEDEQRLARIEATISDETRSVEAATATATSAQAELGRAVDLIGNEVLAVRSEMTSRAAEYRSLVRAEAGNAVETIGEVVARSVAEVEKTTSALAKPRFDLSGYFEKAAPGGFTSSDLVIAPTGETNEFIVIGSPKRARELGTVRGRLSHGLAKSIVGSHALLEMGLGAGEQAGVLVKLTAESAKRLKELNAIPTAGGDAFLGVLRDGSGHFAHVLQLTSVNGLQAATNVAGALTGVALQMQLASLEKSIGEVSKDVRELHEALNRIRLSDERATRQVLLETYRVSSETGVLTDAMWDQIAPLYQPVRKVQEHARLEIEAMIDDITELTGGGRVKTRRDRLEKSADTLEAALSALHEADQMIGQYQALRLWRLIETDDPGLVSYQHEIVRQIEQQADLASRTRLALHRAVRDVTSVNRVRKLLEPVNAKKLERAADRMETQLSAARALAVDRQRSLERLVPQLPVS